MERASPRIGHWKDWPTCTSLHSTPAMGMLIRILTDDALEFVPVMTFPGRKMPAMARRRDLIGVSKHENRTDASLHYCAVLVTRRAQPPHGLHFRHTSATLVPMACTNGRHRNTPSPSRRGPGKRPPGRIARDYLESDGYGQLKHALFAQARYPALVVAGKSAQDLGRDPPQRQRPVV